MKKEEWLRGEIADWRAAGVIDASTADALLSLYLPRESRISRGMLLTGVFGALLAGLGIISVFAANWAFMGHGARAAVAVAPLVACGATAVLARAKGWQSMAFWESLGILWLVSTVAATIVVAQIYNVGGVPSALVLFVAALTLPVVWTTRSTAAMCAWPVLAFVFAGCRMSELDYGNGCRIIGEFLPVMAASVPAYVAFVRRRPSISAMAVGQVMTGLFYSAGVATVVALAISDFSVNADATWVVSLWACSALLMAVSALFKLPVWPTIAVIVASFGAMTTPCYHEHSTGLMFLLYVVSLVFAAATTVFGIVRELPRYNNIGVLLLLWLIFAKFLSSEIGFMAKGIVLIVASVALVAIDIVLVRIKKRCACA